MHVRNVMSLCHGELITGSCKEFLSYGMQDTKFKKLTLNPSHVFQNHDILLKSDVTVTNLMHFIYMISKLMLSLKGIQDTRYTLQQKTQLQK